MSEQCSFRNPPKGPCTAVFSSWHHQLDCKVNIPKLFKPNSESLIKMNAINQGPKKSQVSLKHEREQRCTMCNQFD